MNALQLVLDDLPTAPDERLEAIIEMLITSFLPQLADQACLDLYDMQMNLTTELAFLSGGILQTESALQLVAILTEAVHAGAMHEKDQQAFEDRPISVPSSPLH